jgi:hypothetical protein
LRDVGRYADPLFVFVAEIEATERVGDVAALLEQLDGVGFILADTSSVREELPQVAASESKTLITGSHVQHRCA